MRFCGVGELFVWARAIWGPKARIQFFCQLRKCETHVNEKRFSTMITSLRYEDTGTVLFRGRWSFCPEEAICAVLKLHKSAPATRARASRVEASFVPDMSTNTQYTMTPPNQNSGTTNSIVALMSQEFWDLSPRPCHKETWLKVWPDEAMAPLAWCAKEKASKASTKRQKGNEPLTAHLAETKRFEMKRLEPSSKAYLYTYLISNILLQWRLCGLQSSNPKLPPFPRTL